MGVQRTRAKPSIPPDFPGTEKTQHTEAKQPFFPGLLWNVPHERNSLFTGREEVLKRLHDMLTANKSAALTQSQAISGLGGIGKTQTAIEYAHRYREEYKAVMWARADLQDTLVEDFSAIAGLLKLTEKDAQDQKLAVNAVKRWMESHTDWLLTLDNADDLTIVKNFIPSEAKGHIILTTRAQATGKLAHSIEVEKMAPEEGALFLLRRANMITLHDSPNNISTADYNQAKEISIVVDGLPLALEHAGAYIEETGCGLFGYMNRYQQRHDIVLTWYSKLDTNHPPSVATTWSLSFEKVEQNNPAAAELLRFFAFLHSDAIPEEIITEGASHLGPKLETIAKDIFELDEAVSELRKYSLIHSNADTRTFTVHRLVQAVLKDRMDSDTQRQWVERTILATNTVFPNVEFAAWQQCQRNIAHAQICAALIRQWSIINIEAARLLNVAGQYLCERAQYTEAESLLKRALEIREHIRESEHFDVAQSLNSLVELYRLQGKYVQAMPLCERALAIHENIVETEHPDMALSLNNLARLYHHLGKYNDATTLYQRARAIRETTLGSEHPDVATSLNDLATLYSTQGKYTEAEQLHRQALAIRKKVLGSDHPDVALSLNNLAVLYSKQGKYTEAEQLHRQALLIRGDSPGFRAS